MVDHDQELVRAECWRWASKGVNVKYEVRDSRRGYKAGALREGMKRAYARGCDLVAIFDADFQPEPDFLWRAVPFLLHNPDLALVQARWKFGTSFLPHVRTPARLDTVHGRTSVLGPGSKCPCHSHRQAGPRPPHKLHDACMHRSVSIGHPCGLRRHSCSP